MTYQNDESNHTQGKPNKPANNVAWYEEKMSEKYSEVRPVFVVESRKGSELWMEIVRRFYIFVCINCVPHRADI